MFKRIWKFKGVSIPALVALMLVVGGFLRAFFILRGVSKGPLILHFDDLSGITSVGSMGSIIFIGVLGTGIVLLNTVIAFGLEERDPLLGKLAAAITLVFAALLFIAFTAIISVN